MGGNCYDSAIFPWAFTERVDKEHETTRVTTGEANLFQFKENFKITVAQPVNQVGWNTITVWV